MFTNVSTDDAEEVVVDFIWNEEGEEVMIAGNFLNKWQKKLKMEKVDGVFRLSLVSSAETQARKVLLQVRSRWSLEMSSRLPTSSRLQWESQQLHRHQ